MPEFSQYGLFTSYVTQLPHINEFLTDNSLIKILNFYKICSYEVKIEPSISFLKSRKMYIRKLISEGIHITTDISLFSSKCYVVNLLKTIDSYCNKLLSHFFQYVFVSIW